MSTPQERKAIRRARDIERALRHGDIREGNIEALRTQLAELLAQSDQETFVQYLEDLEEQLELSIERLEREGLLEAFEPVEDDTSSRSAHPRGVGGTGVVSFNEGGAAIDSSQEQRADREGEIEGGRKKRRKLGHRKGKQIIVKKGRPERQDRSRRQLVVKAPPEVVEIEPEVKAEATITAEDETLIARYVNGNDLDRHERKRMNMIFKLLERNRRISVRKARADKLKELFMDKEETRAVLVKYQEGVDLSRAEEKIRVRAFKYMERGEKRNIIRVRKEKIRKLFMAKAETQAVIAKYRAGEDLDPGEDRIFKRAIRSMTGKELAAVRRARRAASRSTWDVIVDPEDSPWKRGRRVQVIEEDEPTDRPVFKVKEGEEGDQPTQVVKKRRRRGRKVVIVEEDEPPVVVKRRRRVRRERPPVRPEKGCPYLHIDYWAYRDGKKRMVSTTFALSPAEATMDSEDVIKGRFRGMGYEIIEGTGPYGHPRWIPFKGNAEQREAAVAEAFPPRKKGRLFTLT